MGGLVCVTVFFLPNFWRYNFFRDIQSHSFAGILFRSKSVCRIFFRKSPTSLLSFALSVPRVPRSFKIWGQSRSVCLDSNLSRYSGTFPLVTSVQGTLPIRGHSLVAKNSSHNLCPFVYFEGTPLFRLQEHFFSGSPNLDLTSIEEDVDGVNW